MSKIEVSPGNNMYDGREDGQRAPWEKQSAWHAGPLESPQRSISSEPIITSAEDDDRRRREVEGLKEEGRKDTPWRYEDPK